MNDFINDLSRRLSARLSDISRQELGTIQKARACSKSVSLALIQLRAFILQYTFRDELDEIYFFKTIKPDILSKYIFHTKVFHIESRRPGGGRHIHQTYLRKEIDKLAQFQTAHPEFHQYYRTGEIYSDHTYFLRKNEVPSLCDDDVSTDLDPQFSTGYDHLVAKIIAYDELSAYLYAQLDALETLSQPAQIANNSDLQWTGSKSALVELIYSLSFSDVVNDGKCDIVTLATGLEQLFQIKIPNIYQIFGEIKYRTSPARFLDSLRDTFLLKLAEEVA